MSLNQKQLLEMMDISRTTLWRMMKRGEFPAPNRDNPRKLIWSAVVIESWVSNLGELNDYQPT
jgi:predicted DNA-binding transcriptional regulator AlpA